MLLNTPGCCMDKTWPNGDTSIVALSIFLCIQHTQKNIQHYKRSRIKTDYIPYNLILQQHKVWLSWNISIHMLKNNKIFSALINVIVISTFRDETQQFSLSPTGHKNQDVAFKSLSICMVGKLLGLAHFRSIAYVSVTDNSNGDQWWAKLDIIKAFLYHHSYLFSTSYLPFTLSFTWWYKLREELGIRVTAR